MKKRSITNPGFEVIFALGVILIFVLPALVYAQGKYQKKMSIIIQDGDTTVNGKKMKDLSAAERKEAMGMFNNGDEKDNHAYAAPRMRWHRIPSDSSGRGKFRFRIDTAAGGGQYFRFDDKDGMAYNMPELRGFNIPGLGSRLGMRNARKHNSQEFSFENVDKDGVHTSVNFSVTEARGDEGKNDLSLEDFTLTPEFSSGKTWLMFNLPATTVADVKLTNGDGKLLWTEKSSGNSFRKSFTFPVNGVYYLTVKQGSKSVVKRIVKEQ